MRSSCLAVVGASALAGCVLAVDFDDFSKPAPTDAGTTPLVDTTDAASSETDAGADSGVLFADGFDRPDGAVGNGWIQGTTGTYAIANSALVPDPSHSFGFTSAWIYQPASTVADMIVSVELTPLVDDSIAKPQVHVRSQTIDNFKAYGAFMVDNTQIQSFRAIGDNPNTLDTVSLSKTMRSGERYRITLGVSGTDPVHVTMLCEHLNGTTWDTLAASAVDDTDPSRIKTAGSFGVSGNGNPNYTFDNFLARTLP